ncbi:MAG TPA: 8-oxo-dGTP diphosphatase [Tissierellaceae bacterium]
MDRCEKVILTNMCMVYKENKILVQNRRKEDYQGIAFPGGHIEKGESIVDSVIRELYEETNLVVKDLVLCGIKQFYTLDNIRYIVFIYKTDNFKGNLKSSKEGEVFFIDRKDITKYNCVDDFLEIIQICDNNLYNEIFIK